MSIYQDDRDLATEVGWFEWLQENWEMFGGLFLMPFLIFKGREWWKRKKWEIVIGTGIGLFLIILVIGYIKKPTIIIKK